MTATVVLALRFALAIALYIFLGWALFTLLQELKQQGNKLSTQKKPGITIFFSIGNKRDGQQHFISPEIMIGRDTHCDLSVLDEALSSHHARITFHHGQWWLEDLNSRNGTFLNREKLNTPAVIITGDQFKCGNTLFDIRVDADDSLPANTN
jgi:pSer/pThr/pTyr-binding forkhead associated (FHA) protein